MSLLLTPLLDALGHPSRTLLYAALTALVLPAAYLGSAAGLGGEVGYVSVAIGWVIGYPLPFALLLFLSLRTIGLPLFTYVARTGGVLACGAIALALGAAARWIALPASPGLRLLAVVSTFVFAFAVLLGRYQGVSLWKLRAALRDAPATPDDRPAPRGR
jgi:hypothetical protein